MNVLVIDENCNGIDFACRLADKRTTEATVFLSTDKIDKALWQRPGLSIIHPFESADQLNEFCTQRTITTIINFSSLLAYNRLLEKVDKTKTTLLGTDRSFAETEYNKLGFKKWLIENNYPTPTIQVQGFLSDIETQLDKLDYPVTIKPDIQTGPSTKVCFNSGDLESYIQEVDRILGASKQAILYVIEDYIESEEVIVFDYHMVGQEIIFEYNAIAVSLPKGQSNSIGASYAAIPYPNHQIVEKEFLSVLKTLASELQPETTYRGELQGMIGKDKKLYFIENNARQPACMVSVLIEDPWMLIDGWKTQNAVMVKQALKPTKNLHAIVTILMHAEPEIELDTQWLQERKDITITPYAWVKKGKKTISINTRMPTLIWSLTDDEASARIAMETAMVEIKEKYPFI